VQDTFASHPHSFTTAAHSSELTSYTKYGFWSKPNLKSPHVSDCAGHGLASEYSKTWSSGQGRQNEFVGNSDSAAAKGTIEGALDATVEGLADADGAADADGDKEGEKDAIMVGLALPDGADDTVGVALGALLFEGADEGALESSMLGL
jgi:hypothetical protein